MTKLLGGGGQNDMFAPPPPPKKKNSLGGGGDCSPAPPGSTPLGASDLDEQGGCVQWRIQDLQKKGWAEKSIWKTSAHLLNELPTPRYNTGILPWNPVLRVIIRQNLGNVMAFYMGSARIIFFDNSCRKWDKIWYVYLSGKYCTFALKDWLKLRKMTFPYGGMDKFGQIWLSSPQSVDHIILTRVVTAPDRISF